MTQISQSGLEAIFAGFKQQWHHTIVTRQYISSLPSVRTAADAGSRLQHTYAKLIENQKNHLHKIHALHELGSHMECNDTLH